MAIPANDVFANTMSPKMITASDHRAADLLEDYDTLKKLRKALDLTQEQIGRKMGTRQVSVAQLEKRSDVLLSTLQDYVEALGGELELIVRFQGRAPVRLQGIGDEKPIGLSSKRTGRSRRTAV
ncbi:helix-turn-helix transcriptional regulator [Rhizobium sp. 0TCS1.26]|uniref:helix-turn-helix domain-containing protein n=1 Tax=Rhizobium sp. 0TCS1.26 TaxID=3142623 RepID=UPI003D2C12AB